jgi:hypothetical protein
MGHSIACGCIQRRLSIRSPHIISAALLLGAHRKQQPSDRAHQRGPEDRDWLKSSTGRVSLGVYEASGPDPVLALRSLLDKILADALLKMDEQNLRKWTVCLRVLDRAGAVLLVGGDASTEPMSIYGAYRILADNAEVITIIVLFLTIPVWRIIATRFGKLPSPLIK